MAFERCKDEKSKLIQCDSLQNSKREENSRWSVDQLKIDIADSWNRPIFIFTWITFSVIIIYVRYNVKLSWATDVWGERYHDEFTDRGTTR